MKIDISNLTRNILEYNKNHKLLFPLTDDGTYYLKPRTFYHVICSTDGQSVHVGEIKINAGSKCSKILDELISRYYGITIFDTIEEAEKYIFRIFH